jgi:pimeloyl-ACP methyl ester carboxylesterase
VTDGGGRWLGRPVAEIRWQLELARLLVDPVLWRRPVPRGDGRRVLLLPGFGGGDQTLSLLALWLRSLGYRPVLGGYVLNADCSDWALSAVERRAERWAEQSGGRVALLGHSRGGMFARALGALRPDLISHAISMGAGLAPELRFSWPTHAGIAAARAVARRRGHARDPDCLTAACGCRYASGFAAEFPIDRVRLTSIYSRGDGVVRWRSMLVPEADCVEVSGSHVGLVFNRRSYPAIADALARPELSSN